MRGGAPLGLLKHYLLESVVRHYVENVGEVLGSLSVSRLLFGSVRLEEVRLVPEAIQDMLFSYIFFACQITRVGAKKLQVGIDWLSIATSSMQIRLGELEMDLALQDPADPVAKPFWDAQALRHKAEQEAVAVPAEATLLYKVSGGFDLFVETVTVRLWPAGDEKSPRVRVTIKGLRYGPATRGGEATTDIDAAICPNPRQDEVAYSYSLSWDSFTVALERTPQGDETAEEASVAVEGFHMSSQGKVPSTPSNFEAPFYVASLLAVQLREVRVPGGGPLSVEALAGIVGLLGRAAGSDALRGTMPVPETAGADGPSGAAEPTGAERLGNEPAPEPGEDCAVPQEGEHGHDAGTLERLQAKRQASRDLESLLAGCSRSVAASGVEDRVLRRTPSPPLPHIAEDPASPVASSKGPAAEARHGAAAPEDDGDLFQDCEEFGLLEVPRECEEPAHAAVAAAVDAADAAPTLRVPEKGLKRTCLKLGALRLDAVLSSGAVVSARLEDLKLSSDSRYDFSAPQAACLRALVEKAAEARRDADGGTPMALPTVSVGRASRAAPGVIYAGLSLDTALLSCRPPRSQEPPWEVARLAGGLRLRHRGGGEPAPHPLGPRQVVDVEVAGLSLSDRGREEVEALAAALSAATSTEAPAAEAPASEDAAPAVVYVCNIEAEDLVLEATAGGQPWRCSLPCVRVQSALDGLEDLWSRAFWGPEVTRGMAEPLGALAVDPVRHSWGEAHHGEEALERPRRASLRARDVIAGLEEEVAHERRTRRAQEQKLREMRRHLDDVFVLLREWPGGPMPLALRRVVAEALAAQPEEGEAAEAEPSPRSRASSATSPAVWSALPPSPAVVPAPSFRSGPASLRPPPQAEAAASPAATSPGGVPRLPGVIITSYDLAVGQEACHVVPGLKRGDSVEWSLDEVHGLTVDVTVVLRSPCRLHAARRLRDTERTSSCRDTFTVTDEFGQEQLPLTLEIQFSNEFSWWAAKCVRLRFCRAEQTLNLTTAHRKANR